MNSASRKRLIITLALCVVFLGLTILVDQYESYRSAKIDFIIYDNQHENSAKLSSEQLADYIHRCGALIDSAAPQWTVHYNGFFRQKVWSFPFAAPVTETLQ